MDSDITSQPAFIGSISAFCVFAVFTISLGIWYWRRMRRSPPTYNYKSPAYQRILAEREARLNAEVAKRRSEEQTPGLGSQVWFSRYIHNGRLRHWVLVIDDTKYELRRADDGRGYTHSISPWTINLEKREAALAETRIPDIDGYYVCLIGWTELPAEQLKRIAADVMAAFGSYNLLWNNCQDFLQRFADRIIKHKALDWSWFRDHAKTEYQEEQKVPPPPEAVVAAQQANLQVQSQTMQNQQQQQTIMNNIQLNNLIIQNQIQTSIAMQAANNPALNPAMNPGTNPAAFGMGGAGA